MSLVTARSVNLYRFKSRLGNRDFIGLVQLNCRLLNMVPRRGLYETIYLVIKYNVLEINVSKNVTLNSSMCIQERLRSGGIAQSSHRGSVSMSIMCQPIVSSAIDSVNVAEAIVRTERFIVNLRYLARVRDSHEIHSRYLIFSSS